MTTTQELAALKAKSDAWLQGFLHSANPFWSELPEVDLATQKPETEPEAKSPL
jgi:hypothetical protein